MSPTVFREGEFRFYFFSREESRMHVNVSHPDGEAKFGLRHPLSLRATSACPQRNSAKPNALFALDAEVTNISGHCLWVLVDDEELALPFSEFPWFRSATIDQVLNVVRPSGPHLYWPDLDVDLSLDSIRHPDHYPLKAKV